MLTRSSLDKEYSRLARMAPDGQTFGIMNGDLGTEDKHGWLRLVANSPETYHGMRGHLPNFQFGTHVELTTLEIEPITLPSKRARSAGRQVINAVRFGGVMRVAEAASEPVVEVHGLYTLCVPAGAVRTVNSMETEIFLGSAGFHTGS